ERDEHGEAPGRVARERQEPDGDRTCDRQQDEDRGEVGRAHLAMRKARTRAAAPAARKKTYVRRTPVWIRRATPPASSAVSPRSVPPWRITGSSISVRSLPAIATAGA